MSSLTPGWTDQALCADPAYADERDDLWFAHPVQQKDAVAEAVAICHQCPVRQKCLNAALAFERGAHRMNRYGIFGGLTGSQRRRLYEALAKQQTGQGPKREPAKCGTRSGYGKHLREQTEPCPPCRQANTDAYNRLVRTGTTKVAA